MGYRNIGTISRTHGTAGAMILTQCTDASLALQSGTPVLIGFSANFAKSYILTSCESYKQSLIMVDPGDAKPVFNYLHQKKLKLSAILITHHHAERSNYE